MLTRLLPHQANMTCFTHLHSLPLELLYHAVRLLLDVHVFGFSSFFGPAKLRKPLDDLADLFRSNRHRLQVSMIGLRWHRQLPCNLSSILRLLRCFLPQGRMMFTPSFRPLKLLSIGDWLLPNLAQTYQNGRDKDVQMQCQVSWLPTFPIYSPFEEGSLSRKGRTTIKQVTLLLIDLLWFPKGAWVRVEGKQRCSFSLVSGDSSPVFSGFLPCVSMFPTISWCQVRTHQWRATPCATFKKIAYMCLSTFQRRIPMWRL